MADVFSSSFAHNIFLQKYSMNSQETWADTCKRVISSVANQYLPNDIKEEAYKAMLARKFIPGGRYLYSAGREFHQVNNCFLFRTEDSREGWSEAMQKATQSLMTGGGIGFDYSLLREEGALIKKTGGTSTGPLALMQMVNEAGRFIMQGGNRRSAIWAGLQWDHPDIQKFLHIKDYPDVIKVLKEADHTFPVPMECTNISVIYNTEFFIAIENKNHAKHKLAKQIWLENCKQAFSTAEPGMSFNFCKDSESLRNACVTGDTKILTKNGYQRIDSLENIETEIWNGFDWSKVTPKITGTNQQIIKITFSDGRELKCTPYHKFHLAKGYNGETEIVEACELKLNDKLIKHSFPIIKEGSKATFNSYAQGFKSAEGMDDYNFLWLYEPKKVCFSRLKPLKTQKEWGDPQAVVVDAPLPKNYVPFDLCLTDKLDWLAGLLDGDGCELKEGGCQISSVDFEFLTDLQDLLSTIGIQTKIAQGMPEGNRLLPDGHGSHKIFFCKESKRLCIGAVQIQELKKLGFSCERLSFDKSPNRDASQFVKVVKIEELGVVDVVYCFNEPKKHLGIFNGVITGQCTEVTSSDDSDKCNLGTVWMNRCESREDFARVCHISTAFLLCGGLYSTFPTEKIKEVGSKNNRIGLGLGGVHEWLMTRDFDYEVTPEMHKWLNLYEQESDSAAYIWSKELGVQIPKGKRAIAPTGTIGIIAETTTGIEPLFCKAYKRRYLNSNKEWNHEYVVDGAVKRLLQHGVPMERIKDAYDIQFKDRVKFQADVQNYVDMAISSTCNLPQWGSETNSESNLDKNAKTLLKYAKRLRGFTCYPDGSRGGQPLTRVSLEEAMSKEGVVFEEKEQECVGGVCGI